MSDSDITFVDEPESAFPITIRAFRMDNDEEVWTEVVEGPGSLEIPPLARQLGCKVRIKVEYGDGETFTAEP